jgi:hypothetical protein
MATDSFGVIMAIPSSQVQERFVVGCLFFYPAEIGLGSDVILACFVHTAALLFWWPQRLMKRDGRVAEVLAEQTLSERFEVFAGFGECEGVGWFGPVKLVAGGLGRDPDLANGSVGSDDELAGAVLEDDVHDTVVVFELEGAVVVLGGDEGLLEGFEGTVGFAAEGCFVDHVVSLACLSARTTDGSRRRGPGVIDISWGIFVCGFGDRHRPCGNS